MRVIDELSFVEIQNDNAEALIELSFESPPVIDDVINVSVDLKT